MGAPVRSAPAAASGAVLAALAASVALLLWPDPPWGDDPLVPNLIAQVTSVLATGCAGWRAWRSTGRRRHAWAALAAGIGCWAVGEALWTWLQATGQEPFPSVADVAFLGFSPLICVGLLLLPVGGGGVHRLQSVLDGLAVSWALLLISWHTALGAAVRASDDRLAAVVFSVAFPVMDVAVLVVSTLTLARLPTETARLPLAFLAGGLVSIAVADSAFVYLTATAGYEPGTAVDIAWNLGFCLLALAALHDTGPPAQVVRGPERAVPTGGLLPYIPVMGSLAVISVIRATGSGTSQGEEVALFGLILLLFCRQYLTLWQNGRLNARLAASEAELRFRADHDPLTGLFNRAAFHVALDRALELHRRDDRPVGLLYLDLNDFKAVNDTYGHAAGDLLLIAVARRVDECTRGADTVARFGGDEFAVLLESGDDPWAAAERITDVLREPIPIGQRGVHARVSTGVVALTAGDPPITADELMARADAAMYVEKRRARRAGARSVRPVGTTG
jgi:diguanylate cyclase (GGDEF)-like protein